MFSADLGVTPTSSTPAPVTTEYFSPNAYSGTGSTQAIVNGINFLSYGGMVWQKKRTLVAGNLNNHVIFDTARSFNSALFPDLYDAEINPGNGTFQSWNSNGFTVGSGSTRINRPGETYISWSFREATGFFDVVTYSGTGNIQTISHNLGAIPRMIIFKQRNASSTVWAVYHQSLGTTVHLPLNLDEGSSPSALLTATPTSSNFTLPASENRCNQSGVNYVAYLFGSLAGGSAVGGYTGNGSTLSVDCGFTTGARFVLIKRSNPKVFGDNAARNWYIWDTARGITSGNDPHLTPNSNAVEASADSIGPNSVGFNVIQNATTIINISGASYVYLAIA